MKKPILFGTVGLAAVGIAIIGGMCISTGNCQSRTVSTLTSTTNVEVPKPVKQEIHWLTSLEAAKEESATTGKPIFVDFYATWCPPCKMMDEKTYPDSKVIAESQKWVMLRIDTDEQQDVAIKYGITALPTLAVLNSDGTPVTGTGGFMNPNQFIEFLEYAQKKSNAQ